MLCLVQVDRTVIWGHHPVVYSSLEAMMMMMAHHNHLGSRHLHHRLRCLAIHAHLHKELVATQLVLHQCRLQIPEIWGSLCGEPSNAPGSQYHSRAPPVPARPHQYGKPGPHGQPLVQRPPSATSSPAGTLRLTEVLPLAMLSTGTGRGVERDTSSGGRSIYGSSDAPPQPKEGQPLLSL